MTDAFSRPLIRGRTLREMTPAFHPPRPRGPVRLAPPVWPNAGVTAWYAVQLQNITTEMQADIVGAIGEAYNTTEAILGMAADAPSRAVRAQIVLDKWSGRWVIRLNKLLVDLATQFADRSFSATQAAMKASFRQAGLTVKFRPTRAAREAYRATIGENVALIKSIPAQYAKDVQAQVWASVQKGSDLSTLTDGLRKSYRVAQKRAELIARDQNAKAKATIENVRRIELGVKKAQWMHSSAGKEPRPTHVAMNGKEYKLTEGMYDDDPRVQEYILPGQLINCRCTSRAVLPGFE